MEVLSIALASLAVLVVAHFAVYWVVRTLYPPTPMPPPPPAAVSFTEPPGIEQQNVRIPTYEAPPPTESTGEEGKPRGPPPAESTSIRGKSGDAVSNA